jgi:hypothetical protein
MGSRIEKSFLPVCSFYRAGKGGDKSWPSHQIEHGRSFCAPQVVGAYFAGDDAKVEKLMIAFAEIYGF